jgi:ubiquinone/menaquinone biosynthesis C-methylase UbiE
MSALCVALLAAHAFSAHGFAVDAQAPPQHGRLFPPLDLGLLEGPDRDHWQMSGHIMDALGIAEGSVVGDLGTGAGWFTIRLARRVGPNGLVYAEDVQPEMLEATSRRASREGLNTVRTVRGTPLDPRFPARALDAILVVDTYHELEDPVTLLRNAATSLKPLGRLGVVDFKKDGLGPGPELEDRVDPDAVIRDARSAGLRLLRHDTSLPYQFFLIFVASEEAVPKSRTRSSLVY